MAYALMEIFTSMLPHLLTLLRLVLVPCLLALAWWPHQQAYFWVFLVALGSDAVDGYLARRLGVASELGARLDSYADLAFSLSTPVCIAWLFPALLRQHALLIGILLGVYLLADLVGYVKFRRLTSYHTRGAKLSAVLLGATILGLFWLPHMEWLLYPSALVAIFSYLEEIAITVTLPRWEANVPSWWAARQRARGHGFAAPAAAAGWLGILSWLTVGALAYDAIVLVGLHLLRPDYNPVQRVMSNYAVGPYGYLMVSAFFGLALALGSLTLGLALALTPSRQARAGLFLLGLAAAGFCIAGAVPKEVRERDLPNTLLGYVHFLGGGMALISLVAAMLLLSAAFGQDERWRPLHRPTRRLALGALAALALAAALALIGWNGLGQRLVFAACLLWLLPTARWLQTLARRSAAAAA